MELFYYTRVHTYTYYAETNSSSLITQSCLPMQASTPQKYCWELDYQFEGRLHMPHGQHQYHNDYENNVIKHSLAPALIHRYCQVPIVQLEQCE